MKRKPALPSGQALLIIVLVMAVALTIGLAVISRSITDIRISSQEEESARVFSAAEAGIEQALKLGAAPSPGTINNISYNVTEIGLGGGTEFVFPNQIEAGDTQTVWLVDHNASGDPNETPFYTVASLNVCWEDTDPETALEVTIFYKDVSGNYKIARGAYDVEAISRSNSFEIPTGTGNCPAGLSRKKTLTWSAFNINPTPPTGTDIILFLRLKPLYNEDNPAKIGVVALGGTGGNLPSQGTCFESSATLETSGITRRVRQCQFHKSPPAVFDYVLFSGGDLSK